MVTVFVCDEITGDNGKLVVIESTAYPAGWMKRMAHVFGIASTLRVFCLFYNYERNGSSRYMFIAR
jgi:hypothetical protein